MHQNPQFIKAITNMQSRIYAFALSMLGDPEAASDVLQETNLVLWEKVDMFDQIGNFPSYALKVAFNQVRNHRRKQQRDQLLFDDDVLQSLAAESEQIQLETSDRLIALRHCMDQLPRHHREVIRQRYQQDVSVNEIASAINKKRSTVAVLLFRIREALLNCIEKRMDMEDKP